MKILALRAGVAIGLTAGVGLCTRAMFVLPWEVGAAVAGVMAGAWCAWIDRGIDAGE